ncbi:MAG: plastocyanin/azurin family copper-binding protein [Nitrososphaeraceae archaeon]
MKEFKSKSSYKKLTCDLTCDTLRKKYIIPTLLVFTLFFSFITPINFIWGSEYTVSIPYEASNPSLKKSFEPGSIDVKIGDKITWINMDEMMHSVTSINIDSQDEFDSGLLHLGQEFELAIDKAGNYDYYCTFHPFMQGKISVT